MLPNDIQMQKNMVHILLNFIETNIYMNFKRQYMFLPLRSAFTMALHFLRQLLEALHRLGLGEVAVQHPVDAQAAQGPALPGTPILEPG